MKKKAIFLVILTLLVLAAGCKGRKNPAVQTGDDLVRETEMEADAGKQNGGAGDVTDEGNGADGSSADEPDVFLPGDNKDGGTAGDDGKAGDGNVSGSAGELVAIERTGEEEAQEAEDGTQLFAGGLYYPNVQITGRPEVSAKINEVFEAQKQKDTDTSAEYLELAREEYKNQLEMGMDGFWGFALNRDYMIPFQGTRLLTIKEVLYSYAGGVHPSSEMLVWNFDLESGDVVELNDLAKEPEKFQAFLEERINRYLEEQQLEDGDGTALTEGLYPNYRELIREELKAPVWYVSEEKLWIIFNEYVLAPYAAGIIETEVPLADCREYLTEEALMLLESLPETVSGQ